MKMKTFFLSLLLAFTCVGLKAQNNPKSVTLQVNEFEYKKPSAGRIALNILGAVGAVMDPENSIYTSNKSMVPQINEAIASAASGKPWLTIYKDQAGTPDYILRGTITDSQIGSGIKRQSCFVAVNATIVDAKTGEVVASKICKGSDLSYNLRDLATLKASVAAELTKSVSEFIFSAIPVTGTVLEKGVEQLNGKIKDNQCYVNLGSMHGVKEGMKLYITQDGKYKGELKVKEVMGDDLSSCKISKGASFIAKSLADGSSITVTSKPKKIKND